MKARELVAELSTVFGIPTETAVSVDRSLFEAGLRRKGRGRLLPDVSRSEAVTFLIACMVAGKATKAAEIVAPWLEFIGTVVRDDEHSACTNKNLHALRPLLKQSLRRGVVSDIIGLVDFLIALTEAISSGMIEADSIRIEFDLSDPVATVDFHDQEGRWSDKLAFFHPNSEAPREWDGRHIRMTSEVWGAALLEIAKRTEASDD